ncbi:branched-chain amino acid ABC transporter permease, partial [Zavarzinia sp.]|uniref:branched-chain amino acid ABC transporter permease n=1 Tax=Zavarzinia sp. TaxID=2027920 RepID=UPI00356995C1
LFSLGVVAVLTLAAWRLTRSEIGRSFVAVRDRDVAAASLGISILRVKLVAFAVSSFVVGVAGALWAFAYLRTVEPAGFDLDRSFQILFIVIIGGLASIRGAFLGAGFIVVFPLILSRLGQALFGDLFDSGVLENAQKIVVGGLIIAFLIAEPAGLSALIARLTRRRPT